MNQGFRRETPVKEPYTGEVECKGNKIYCQDPQKSIWLHYLFQLTKEWVWTLNEGVVEGWRRMVDELGEEVSLS